MSELKDLKKLKILTHTIKSSLDYLKYIVRKRKSKLICYIIGFMIWGIIHGTNYIYSDWTVLL